MSSSSKKKHDVFISFRGEDTRKGITSHLHIALEKQKIETFIDYNLKKGEEVWPKLEAAIKDSDMSVVVFSEIYANSKWCLKELVEIMKCRAEEGQVVIPVFYEIDPSHIRKQSGSYEEAFVKLEQDLRNDVSFKDDEGAIKMQLSEWRGALTGAANINGWDSSNFRDDAQLIANIVQDITQKLYQKYPNELEGIVENIKALSEIESILKSVSVIGIWGMGGAGKTTIARTMFAKHFPQYDSSCFLANVREESEKHGLPYLVHKLLFDLLKEPIHSSHVVGGSLFIKRRISSSKVFIVLDDVDSADQLEDLCKALGELGPDSRLIVTTRNKKTLKKGVVHEIYELEQWNFEDAMHLFCFHAFDKEHPDKGYEHLSERAVKYAGRLPLALKVLGTSLHGGDSQSWEDSLNKLEKYPNEKILNVLQVSFDGLDYAEKNIFLDIAFFFKGKDKDFAVRILDACDFHADAGINTLINKALISISHSKIIQMHDLLQEFGLNTVREECRDNPGGRSRLRDIKEVCNVLSNNKGTDKVKGITLDLSQTDDLKLSDDAFIKMISLRFLRFHGTLGTKSDILSHPRVFKNFSNELRYLEWNGYPLKYLPPKFCAEFLVEFHMPHSNVKELWQKTQDLVNLVRIDLRECKHLMKLPDLSKASKLKWLNLSGCESLCAVHLSMDSLVSLVLDGCKKLNSLKSEKNLPFLEEVSVNGCSSLKEFLVSSDSLTRLDLSTTVIQILHPLIDHFRKLVLLNLDGRSMERLPESIKDLLELEILSLKNCRKLRSLPVLPPSIQEFCADNCTSLETVSTLMSFAAKMKGKEKLISFKNCKKLDGRSLQHVVEVGHITMMSAAFHNEVEKTHKYRYDYVTAAVSLAGSRVPSHSTYQTTESSSITIQLDGHSNILGFIYCVVLSPSQRMKTNDAEIQCQCYFAGGSGKKMRYGSKRPYNVIRDLNSDHVYAWCDPYHTSSILDSDEQQLCFEFSATSDDGSMMNIKECGVHVIRTSDLDRCFQIQDPGMKNFELVMKMRLMLNLIQRYVELESRLLFASDNGLKPTMPLKLEFESRRQAILALIGKERETSKMWSRPGYNLLGVKILVFAIGAYVTLKKVIKKK